MIEKDIHNIISKDFSSYVFSPLSHILNAILPPKFGMVFPNSRDNPSLSVFSYYFLLTEHSTRHIYFYTSGLSSSDTYEIFPNFILIFPCVLTVSCAHFCNSECIHLFTSMSPYNCWINKHILIGFWCFLQLY